MTNVTMKENNGKGAAQRFWKQISAVISITFFVIGLIGVFDVRRKTSSSGNRRRRRQWQEQQQHIRREGADNIILPSSRVGLPAPTQDQQRQAVLDASYTLVDISVSSQSLIAGIENEQQQRYKDVYGVFCPIRWELHRDDPSKYPMFRDLVEASDCRRHSVRFDLWSIVQEARNIDTSAANAEDNRRAITKVLPIGGVVFHESRCGSTLVANALVASHPTRHRVYSESPPPVEALQNVCSSSYDNNKNSNECDAGVTEQLLKDVIYLMSRASVENDNDVQTVFFKIQSIGTVHLRSFIKVFPTTPWMFLYRDPVQVMMSHLPPEQSRNILNANCLRTYHRPNKNYHALIHRLAPTKSFETLTHEQHCAAHLAQIAEAARYALDNDVVSNKGMLVNYADLPERLIMETFPKHFGILVDEQSSMRIKEISTHYSKGRDMKDREWKEDSHEKNSKASLAVREASDMFLRDTYEWMNVRSNQ